LGGIGVLGYELQARTSGKKFSEISGYIEIIEVLKFEKGKWKIQKLK